MTFGLGSSKLRVVPSPQRARRQPSVQASVASLLPSSHSSSASISPLPHSPGMSRTTTCSLGHPVRKSRPRRPLIERGRIIISSPAWDWGLAEVPIPLHHPVLTALLSSSGGRPFVENWCLHSVVCLEAAVIVGLAFGRPSPLVHLAFSHAESDVVGRAIGIPDPVRCWLGDHIVITHGRDLTSRNGLIVGIMPSHLHLVARTTGGMTAAHEVIGPVAIMG